MDQYHTITHNGTEYSVLRTSATQFIMVEGIHQFYDKHTMYSVLYDTQTDFVFMNQSEIDNAFKNGTIRSMKFRECA